ncbi:RNA-binding protein 44 [Athene noctua]|uniref:RNA-binding protein 44 n=1 Tax=Athene noctua TaxID=126797 RepID=UPI003EC12953
MLVLEELKKSYNSMRMKIKMGVPLNALPPLSVEMKVFQVSSSYVPCKLFREDLCYNSVSGTRKADFEAPKLQERKISVNTDKPQTVCLSDGGQPSDSTSFKALEVQHKDQHVESEVKKMESGNECSFIRVGGLRSSVSEDNLRSHFQKYQISDIVTCVDSGNYRYAFLCFKDTNKAKLAVEEMNQKKIKGKPLV